MPRKAAEGLSAREREVLGWAAEGKSRGDTAMILGVAESTIMHYRREACRKLDACNVTKAVAVAIRRGLI